MPQSLRCYKSTNGRFAKFWTLKPSLFVYDGNRKQSNRATTRASANTEMTIRKLQTDICPSEANFYRKFYNPVRQISREKELASLSVRLISTAAGYIFSNFREKEARPGQRAVEYCRTILIGLANQLSAQLQCISTTLRSQLANLATENSMPI